VELRNQQCETPEKRSDCFKQTIYLVRHGETDANKDGIYQGRSVDNPLNDTGRTQAELLGKFLKDFQNYFPSPGIIYSSSSLRALETAAIIEYSIFKSHPLLFISVPDLQEINHGLWEGKRHEQISKEYPFIYNLWQTNPMAVRFPGGETAVEANERVISAWKKIMEFQNGHILIVGHVVTNLFILCHALKNPKMIRGVRQHNACLNVLEKQGDIFKDILLNSTLHLT